MAIPHKSPEQRQADREAREQRAAEEAAERAAGERRSASLALLVFGLLLIAVGAWYLVVAPSEGATYAGESIVNLQRLIVGQTCAIAGVICFAAGALIRYA